VDTDQWNYPPRDLRLSDTDRDRALAELSEHFQAGRLTAGELDDRSGRILRARTFGELADVLADLPRDRAVLPVPGRSRRRFSAGIIVAVVIVIVVGMLGRGHGHSGGGHSALTIMVPAAIVLLLVLRRVRGGEPGRRRWRR
jgi:multisubunit Na+/H+ antiporter MnhB subunit